MKLQINSISKFARDVFHQKKHTSVIRLTNPRRDWNIGLGIGLFILIGITSWSAYMYTSNRTLDTSDMDLAQTKVPVYRAAAVADALTIFEEKQTDFDILFSRQFTQPVAIVEEIPEPILQVGVGTTSTSTAIEVAEDVATLDAVVSLEEESSQPQSTDQSPTEQAEENLAVPTLSQ